MVNEGIYQPLVQRRTHSVLVREVKYCVHEWGDADAPLIFYLHGWADTGSTFQFVVDAFQSDWRIVAPDWRGFGRSVHHSHAYWFPDYLADLHALLEIYSATTPVRLVGHSMGGNIAALYAGVMAERVSAIVNIEGFGLQDSDPNDAPRRYRDWLEAGCSTPRFTSYANFQKLVIKLRQRNPRLSAAQAEFVAREWAVEIDGEVRLRADPYHKLPNAVLYRRTEAMACWRNISAPMLFVSGAASSFVAQAGGVDAASIPASEFCSLPGIGHMIHFEAPAALAEKIEAFLRKHL